MAEVKLCKLKIILQLNCLGCEIFIGNKNKNTTFSIYYN